jgi:RNA polymerase sigma-70 factor, ECF subfamily
MGSTPNSLPDLDAYRGYLLVLARGQIPQSMQARLDASDIVQDTLLEAHRKREQFEGGNEPGQLAGWLRQLLSFNLIDAMRAQQRGRRDVRREQAMRNSIDESAVGLEHLLIADDTSPSLQVNRQAQVLRVANAIEGLPEQQRVAVLMRYCQQRTLEEISQHLAKSKSAVAGLLKRGLATLRQQLTESER